MVECFFKIIPRTKRKIKARGEFKSLAIYGYLWYDKTKTELL